MTDATISGEKHDIPNVAPYGYCPVCGSPGVSRERGLNGDDRCAAGHVYSARSAVLTPALAAELQRQFGMKHVPPDELERRHEQEAASAVLLQSAGAMLERRILAKDALSVAGTSLEIQIRRDGQLVWINVDGICALRVIVANDAPISVDDQSGAAKISRTVR